MIAEQDAVRHLRGELTAALSRVSLDDQTPALGIHYFCKYGTQWSCWAVWLHHDVHHRLGANQGQAVTPPADNAALAAVLDAYHLTAE